MRRYLTFLLLAIAVSRSPLRAALSAATVFEVRTGGADTNGCGFVATGTDWSLQNGAQYAVTDAVTAGTTTITSVAANFGTDVVGNILYITGGTGAIVADRYQIITRASSTSITVDRSTGLTAGTGATLNIGGACASAAEVAGDAIAGNIIFVKYNASAYSQTSAVANVAAGSITPTSDVLVIGYDTTRTTNNTDANRPTIRLNVSTANVFGGTGTYTVQNFNIDCNSQTTSRAWFARGLVNRVTVTNCTNGAFATNGGSISQVFDATATGCSSVSVFGVGGSAAFDCWYCEAYDNTVTAFSSLFGCYGCIADSNSGASSDGFSSVVSLQDSVAYNNGRDGVRNGSSNGQAYIVNNVISESNTGWGFNMTHTTAYSLLKNVAYFGNGSGAVTNTTAGHAVLFNSISGGSSFFTNAASGDFSLNNTASAGASARNTGYPATFLRGTTSTYLDVGAARHQDAGPKGGANP